MKSKDPVVKLNSEVSRKLDLAIRTKSLDLDIICFSLKKPVGYFNVYFSGRKYWIPTALIRIADALGYEIKIDLVKKY